MSGQVISGPHEKALREHDFAWTQYHNARRTGEPAETVASLRLAVLEAWERVREAVGRPPRVCPVCGARHPLAQSRKDAP